MRLRLVYVSIAASIALAATSLAFAQRGGATGQTAPAAAAATPRMADGKPDLSGTWGGGGGGGGNREYEGDGQGDVNDIFPSRRCAPSQVKCSEYTNQAYDGEVTARMSANPPLYKTEFWDKVQLPDI